MTTLARSQNSLLCGVVLFFAGSSLVAQPADPLVAKVQNGYRQPRLDVLSTERWKQIDSSAERALAWLATQQQPDGSFPTKPSGQPAVTSLCVIAYLSCGHTPGQGPHGERLNRAIDYVLGCQREN